MESQKDIQKDVKVKKTEKLVTAIFMVTGLMDKDEPIRHELRSASLKLLSDTHSVLVSQLMSLINIATSISLISDMNGAIIGKELSKLNDSFPVLETFNFSEDTYLPERSAFSRTFQGQNKIGNNVVYKPKVSVSTSRPLEQLKSPVSKEVKSNRRDSILKLIREKNEARPSSGGVTIKDISSNISDCSEKTIQRELISLLKDKVIKKTGEKRWSKYYI